MPIGYRARVGGARSRDHRARVNGRSTFARSVYPFPMRVTRWGWRIPVAVTVVALTATAVALATVAHRRALEASFRSQGIAFAVAFADAAEAWLASGNTAAVEGAARLMLMGSVAYVQVVAQGATVVDARRDTPAQPELPESDLSPRLLSAAYRTLSGGTAVLDVAVPLLEGGPGYVRLGLDAQEIASWARAGALLAAGAGIGFDLFVLTFLLTGRRRPSSAPGAGGARAPGFSSPSGLVVDGTRKEATLDGVPVPLSPKLFAVLSLLVSDPGRVFSDREILSAVWPDSRYANAKDVKQHVYLLRKRLRQVRPGAEGMIVTVPGFGYRFEPRGNGD